MAKKPRAHPQPDLRSRAEQVIQEQKIELQELGPEETQHLLHELRVHQIELEMQNDELRLAHTQLEASYDRFADLYDFAPVGYLTLKADGLIEEANLTVASWLGMERSNLIGHAFTSLVPPQDQNKAYLHFQKLQESGETQHTELRLIKQDRSAFFVRLDSTLRKTNSPQLPLIRTTLVDITERKEVEAALHQSYAEMETKVLERTNELAHANQAFQESEDRLRFAIDVADICYWVWDTQTNLLHWGGPHGSLFHLETDQSIDTYDQLLQHIYPSDRPAFRHTMDSLLGGGASPELEFRIRWEADTTRWVSAQARAYQSASSGPFCVLGVMQDITERKHSEQARAELLRTSQIARDLAEQATQIRTQFLGMISHELRTPLTSIKGFATTLMAEDIHFDDKQSREMLSIIDQETDLLVELVEHLLDISQIQAGALKITPVPVALAEVIALGLSQFEALTGHHELRLPIALDLPMILVDPARIVQVITNLISNAVKHSPPNSVVSLSAHQIGPFIRVSVSDEGSGIPPEQRETVFQAFEQLETQPQLASGVGLGLAICKSLVEAHGGHIWIEDQPEVGTTLSFTVPIVSL